MMSFRSWIVLTSLAMSAALAFGQSPLDRKPRPGNGGGGSPPSQGDRKPNNPPSKPPEQAPRPNNPPSKPEIDRPRPKPPEEKPRPINDFPRPKPPEEKPRPINNPPNPNPFDQVKPRPIDEKPRPKPPEQGPKPPEQGPRPNDDLLRPRPRPGQGNGGGNPGNGGPGSSGGGNEVKPDRNPRPLPPQNPGQGSGQNPPGRWDSPNPIGRINNGSQNNGRPGDNMLGRRNGNTYGGSVSNSNRGDNRVQKPALDRAPVDIFRGSLGHQVRREDNVRISNRGWRSGYHHYRRDWCDDNFWFNWYVFDPFRDPCYVSPWYYYRHLPGYISYRCATVVNISLTPFYGTVYNWYRPSRWDDYSYRRASELDYALEDITRAFERMDRRALRRLIPQNDRIAIFVDGRYNYSMTPDDFEEFLIDAIEGTQTDRYTVTRVERKGREAEVTARHDYTDSWGQRETVYHWYRLEEERGNYVIRRFGTSYYDQ